MFKWFKNKKKDNKGFTLVELVIVIAILAILVGLLAPQYTKYVEKSRKAADASNMDEMVKVIKVYAADPANELEAGKYMIKITPASGTSVEVRGLEVADTVAATSIYGKDNHANGLGKELEDSIPSWYKTNTKSQKWGENGIPEVITATVIVGKDGGTSVAYAGTKFNTYMTTGSETSK